MLIIVFSGAANADELKTRNVILITLDGLRWQELFGGADAELLNNKEYNSKIDETKQRYWRDTPAARREALMPFMWGTVAERGQLHGNRSLGSTVDLTNKHFF
ncbi:MAG: phosphoglyceromutase, partial [Planctomycetota bacterium]